MESAQEAEAVPATQQDPRDIVILELAETIKQLTTSAGTIGRQPDQDYFEFLSPRKMHGAPRSPRRLADKIPSLSELTEEWIADKKSS